ncbi:hypothetical protein ACA910_019044 [Epithemia clementina (nom. ined.)]
MAAVVVEKGRSTSSSTSTTTPSGAKEHDEEEERHPSVGEAMAENQQHKQNECAAAMGIETTTTTTTSSGSSDSAASEASKGAASAETMMMGAAAEADDAVKADGAAKVHGERTDREVVVDEHSKNDVDVVVADGAVDGEAMATTTGDTSSTSPSSSLASSVGAQVRAWLETMLPTTTTSSKTTTTTNAAECMAAFHFALEEEQLLVRMMTASPSVTITTALEVEEEVDDDDEETREYQGATESSQRQHSRGSVEPETNTDSGNGGCSDTAKKEVDADLVGGEGDEEDTAATSRSGSNPETDDKESEAAVSAFVGHSLSALGDRATPETIAKAETCWFKLLDHFVVVFPCVWADSKKPLIRTEGSDRLGGKDDDEEKERIHSLLQATLKIDAEMDGPLSSFCTAQRSIGLLNVLDELCLFYFQRRFLADRSAAEQSLQEEENISGSFVAAKLLRSLEQAAMKSFASSKTHEDDDDVERFKRLLSQQQQRWSTVALPSDLKLVPTSDDDALNCDHNSGNNDNDDMGPNACSLIIMPFVHLRSLLLDKRPKQRFISWREVAARVEEFLHEHNGGGNDHEHLNQCVGKEDKVAVAAGATLCDYSIDTKEQRIDENDQIINSEEEFLGKGASNAVASEVEESKLMLPGESEGTQNDSAIKSNSGSANHLSNKKRKKRKGKKKKHRPSVESNTDGKESSTRTLEEEEDLGVGVEVGTTDSKNMEQSVDGKRIPEQQQPDDSEQVVAAPDIEGDCQDFSAKAAAANKEKDGQTLPAETEKSRAGPEIDGDDISMMESNANDTVALPSVSTSTTSASPAKTEESWDRHETGGEVLDETADKKESPGSISSASSVDLHASVDSRDSTGKSIGRRNKASTAKSSVLQPVQPTSVTSNAVAAQQQQEPQQQSPPQQNDSEWETVSTRSRGRKNNPKSSNHDNSTNHAARAGGMSAIQQQQQPNHKNSSANKDQRNKVANQNSGSSGHNNSSNNQSHHNHSGRRKNNSSRKIARDIVFSVLDGVEDELRVKQEQRLHQQQSTIPTANAWHAARVQQQPQKQVSQSQNSTAQTPSNRAAVVVTAAAAAAPNKSQSGAKQRHIRPSDGDASKRNDALLPKQTSTLSRSSALGSAPADQGTAPTYQETVSALSSASNTVENSTSVIVKSKQEINNTNSSVSPNHQPAPDAKVGGSGGSVDDVETATHPTDRITVTNNHNNSSSNQSMRSPVPPLPTLLSPENANSTASSVASSLEAPHGRHHHLHHAPSQDEHNAVGYHLLDVCDRLSQDIALFMKSRAQAVSLRRSERAVLLGALQEVVSGIWSNSCRVELYGSCATLLDLPSSDMDVVIIGLDNRSSGVFSSKSASDFTSISGTRSKSDGSADDSGYQASPQPSKPAPPQPPYIPVYSANAHRVMRLAGAIERLPWAVQVKSIPNATVPVIKILADPSKIPGFSARGEWQGFGSTSSELPFDGAATPSAGTPIDPNTAAASRVWRGSDLMNGLISLDITFQGPEHGGIGSTDYSWHVVNRVCQEMGISNPDDTPFVQCLMVLKELLVQRKLNEPYSGGLSSYALLLLLTALMRERAAIREELERVEQHRQTATTTASPVVSSPPLLEEVSPQSSMPTVEQKSAPRGKRSGCRAAVETRSTGSEDGRTTPVAKSTSTTSWASVARNTEPKTASSEGTAAAVSKGQAAAVSNSEQRPTVQQQEERKPISFADVVGKSSTPTTSLTATAMNKDPAVPRPTSSPQKSSAWQSKLKWEKRGQHGSGDTTPSNARNGGSQKNNRNSGSSHCMSDNGSYSSKLNDKSKNGKKNTSSSIPDVNTKNVEMKGDLLPQTVLLEQQFQHPQYDPNMVPAFFPQGFDDVIEVLCLGETTSGKLLMHFLLHYGQYFDAATTAIDISGKHERVFNTPYLTPYSYMTPFIERAAPESIDPLTGMLVVDHIVIYDPLEGAEKHNVARRCFAWHQVRWIFAQSYATLSSAVEKSAASRSMAEATSPNTLLTSRSTNTTSSVEIVPGSVVGVGTGSGPTYKEALPSTTTDLEAQTGDLADLSSPLLRCLLSF